jgi:hypothetical protein
MSRSHDAGEPCDHSELFEFDHLGFAAAGQVGERVMMSAIARPLLEGGTARCDMPVDEGAAVVLPAGVATGGERISDREHLVFVHLEGDFPGGTADLTYRFTIDADKIAALTIAG